MVGAYSKWLEVCAVQNVTSSTVISELRNISATFDIVRDKDILYIEWHHGDYKRALSPCNERSSRANRPAIKEGVGQGRKTRRRMCTGPLPVQETQNGTQSDGQDSSVDATGSRRVITAQNTAAGTLLQAYNKSDNLTRAGLSGGTDRVGKEPPKRIHLENRNEAAI